MDRKCSKYLPEMATTRKIVRKSHQRLLVSLSFCIRFPFGATMDFSDHESSPELSCSGKSSVEFVAECGGTTEHMLYPTAQPYGMCVLIQ